MRSRPAGRSSSATKQEKDGRLDVSQAYVQDDARQGLSKVVQEQRSCDHSDDVETPITNPEPLLACKFDAPCDVPASGRDHRRQRS